jgi:hypothetical protein
MPLGQNGHQKSQTETFKCWDFAKFTLLESPLILGFFKTQHDLFEGKTFTISEGPLFQFRIQKPACLERNPFSIILLDILSLYKTV